LSVNVAALAFITASAIMGMPSPFNTLQLLWINVIMDGPPALTLGLEPPSRNLMKLKPVKRDSPIVDKKTFMRLFASGMYMGAVMLSQYLYNFLGALPAEKGAATFTLFISFQLFNAFNCRELGENSIFKNFGKNKIMVATFTGVFIAHLIIVQVAYKPFGIAPMNAALWVKCLITASSIVAFSELGKLAYRIYKGRTREKTLSVKVNKNQCKA
ncbi:MAG: cation transporting ATPase C-terminal domain-containing protein, partial [Clostridia bacterium]|nr:cation transporting ATPase C-terminal domain-containing protein [Clostridia bacterium]